ncbi:hypothetical protein JCM14076_08000 [Methylosoma difficile]
MAYPYTQRQLGFFKAALKIIDGALRGEDTAGNGTESLVVTQLPPQVASAVVVEPVVEEFIQEVESSAADMFADPEALYLQVVDEVLQSEPLTESIPEFVQVGEEAFLPEAVSTPIQDNIEPASVVVGQDQIFNEPLVTEVSDFNAAYYFSELRWHKKSTATESPAYADLAEQKAPIETIVVTPVISEPSATTPVMASALLVVEPDVVSVSEKSSLEYFSVLPWASEKSQATEIEEEVLPEIVELQSKVIESIASDSDDAEDSVLVATPPLVTEIIAKGVGDYFAGLPWEFEAPSYWDLKRTETQQATEPEESTNDINPYAWLDEEIFEEVQDEYSIEHTDIVSTDAPLDVDSVENELPVSAFFANLPWQATTLKNALVDEQKNAEKFFQALPWRFDRPKVQSSLADIAGLATQTALNAAQRTRVEEHKPVMQVAKHYFNALPW